MLARIGPIEYGLKRAVYQNKLPHALVGLVLFVFSFVSAGPRYSSRIVETRSGSIRGVILELNSKHLEPVEVFKAVPYAQPPVGPLRYEPPKPPMPWQGARLADTFGPVCPQNLPDVTNRTVALATIPIGRYQYLRKILPLLVNQSEDCLTINIYVPGSGNRGLEAPYSVLFFIHGESFEWGSGNPYDGSVLASYGHVIVITVNFRLGILGFLKTRSAGAGSGGNLGLLDIIAALQWTKGNIASFGGDPQRITLVGHDTGAALANFVLISKSARGLVQRAILLSGSALSPWAHIPDPDLVREQVSQQMACHLDAMVAEKSKAGNVINDITPCLKSKPLQALMGVRLPDLRFMPSWGPFLPFDDSPDPEFAMEHSGESFITSQLMIGMTTTESYNDFSASDIQYGLEEDQRNRIMRTYIRNAFTFHLNEIFSAVRNEYTDWDKPIQHPINIRDSTMEALSDGHTVAPLIKVGYLHARRGAKTYLFHFGYQTKDSEYPQEQRLGSVRGEDIPYIFGLPLVLGVPHFQQNYSRQDMGVSEAVLNFITNFCKTGDPNEAGHQQAMLHPDYGTVKERTRYRGITWETYETTTQQYLSIALKPKMKSHYRGHKMAVWLNLIPQLHRPGDPEVSMMHHHFKEKETHYYDGSVRAESLIRPQNHYANDLINGVQESRQESYGLECTPDPTQLGGEEEDSDEDSVMVDDETENELLDRIITKHYYSYTAALGVTVGVGCLLLILNMLIFAGIYYQRDRSRRKKRNPRRYSNGGGGVGGGGGSPVDDISLATMARPCAMASSGCKSQLSSNILSHKEKLVDLPPNYNALQQEQQHHHHLHHQQQPHGSPCQQQRLEKDYAVGAGGTLQRKKCSEQVKFQQSSSSSSPSTGTGLVSNSAASSPSNSTCRSQMPYKCSTLNNKGHLHHHHHHPPHHHSLAGPLPPQPPLRSSSNDQPVVVTELVVQQVDEKPMPNSILASSHSNNMNGSNSSGTSTLKKRVQIQEITV